jgi:hypothetical protein
MSTFNENQMKRTRAQSAHTASTARDNRRVKTAVLRGKTQTVAPKSSVLSGVKLVR